MPEQTHATDWVPGDSFPLRLVILRAALGLSQEEAAAACSLKPSTWAAWEHGARPHGMDEKVRQISAGLGVDRGWLMFGGPLRAPEQAEALNRCTEAEQLVLPLAS